VINNFPVNNSERSQTLDNRSWAWISIWGSFRKPAGDWIEA